MIRNMIEHKKDIGYDLVQYKIGSGEEVSIRIKDTQYHSMNDVEFLTECNKYSLTELETELIFRLFLSNSLVRIYEQQIKLGLYSND